ncbi:class I SAM-dependent methyltransferase [Brucepastera parasyntrophica]|uniref:class I SAM-dependent methyltransferase n=1 Tax=Brucepastera parasyntrophica TaxID=2880008 RepID=UPI00210A7936|nr:class I SAM-dependent methyltransferase [Brucepastera parasyntrophica]ULQ60323.1 class I SAM-dependent methyltransferase [Brucepastera parasyntrophica]
MENDVFNLIANKYDTKDRRDLAQNIVSAIKPELSNSKDKSLVDYGGGTGLVGLELLPFIDSLLLVDSSEQMLKAAGEKIRQANIKNAKTLRADFSESNPDIKADIIVASLVLLHIPDTEKILRQFYSVLNTGGKLIIVDFDKNEKVSHPAVHNGFTQIGLRSLLTDAGFKEISIKTFYHGKNIFMNQDASMLIAAGIKPAGPDSKTP